MAVLSATPESKISAWVIAPRRNSAPTDITGARCYLRAFAREGPAHMASRKEHSSRRRCADGYPRKALGFAHPSFELLTPFRDAVPALSRLVQHYYCYFLSDAVVDMDFASAAFRSFYSIWPDVQPTFNIERTYPSEIGRRLAAYCGPRIVPTSLLMCSLSGLTVSVKLEKY